MMLIRPASSADIDQIYSVHTRSIRQLCCSHYPPEHIEAWAGNKAPERYLPLIGKMPFFVAEAHTSIIGFTRYSLKTHEFCSLYVDPVHTRKGVGTALAQYVFADAQRNGITTLWLDGALNAVPFYKAIGFKWIDERIHKFGKFSLKCARMEIDLRG